MASKTTLRMRQSPEAKISSPKLIARAGKEDNGIIAVSISPANECATKSKLDLQREGTGHGSETKNMESRVQLHGPHGKGYTGG